MTSPIDGVYHMTAAEEQAHVKRFAELLRRKLIPLASYYRYAPVLQVLDNDAAPETSSSKDQTGEHESPQSARASALVTEADRQFRQWKQLSVDLLADKDGKSEGRIRDETERIRGAIEAQARALPPTTGESTGRVGEADVSWLDQIMAHRNPWRRTFSIVKEEKKMRSPPPRETGLNERRQSLPPNRPPFRPINGQPPHNRRKSTTGNQTKYIHRS